MTSDTIMKNTTRRWLKIVLPAAAIAASLFGAAVLFWTRPQLEPQIPEIRPPVIRVVEAKPESVQLTVSTHGTVAPRTESDLVPQVSGTVVWVSPSLVSGGFFEQGDALLRIDPRDYEIELESARAGLARSRSEQVRAGKELERQRGLGKTASRAQLDDAINAEATATARRREAQAAVERAERDLARTEILASYSGRVREESVSVGQFVARGSPVAKLYATDYAEVRLPVPDSQLAYLDLPLWRGSWLSDGPEVTLRARFAGSDHRWTGRVVRTEGEIDARTRMVHVVARVEDPYERQEPERPDDERRRAPLAVGLFVKAEIAGRRAHDVVTLPRSALREGDQVAVVDTDDRLRLRDVGVLRADREQVLVESGLAAGERVSVSSLEAVVDGMKVCPRPVGTGAPPVQEAEPSLAPATAEDAETPS
jgi:RND family efflux transporter MFP subunit